MDYGRYDRHVEEHVGECLEELAELCRIPSVSAEGGPALARAAERVAELCARWGVRAELIAVPGGPPVVLGQAGDGDRGLLVYNHYDVQPPDPLDEWTSPPFDPQVRDGGLYARGAADNKGSLVARLAAVHAYKETIGPLPLRLVFLFEGEEEVGSPHLEAFAREHAELLQSVDGCLWEGGGKDEHGRPLISLGVKGDTSFELRVRTANADAHSSYGGIYPNAAWRLAEALATLRAPDGRVTIDGLMEHVRPPSEADLALVQRIPFDADAVRAEHGMRAFLGDLTGSAALRRLFYEPTCSINGLLAGYTGPGSKTVIPCRAMAKLDLRLVPDLAPELVAQLVRAHLARRGFEEIEVIDLEDGLMPVRTDPGAPLVRRAVEALRAVGGVDPVIYPTSPGSGPMYQLCRGLPTVSFGVGWAGARIHAPNESLRIADLVQGIRALARFWHGLAAGS